MHKSSMEETGRLLHRKTYETPGDGENGRPAKTREQTGISIRTSRFQMHLNMSMDTKEVVLASQLSHIYFEAFSPTNGSVRPIEANGPGLVSLYVAVGFSTANALEEVLSGG